MSNSSTGERGTIYTLGYSQPKAAARLEQLMRHPHTLLVDVRYQPVSRWNPQWNRAALAGRYGQRYVWDRRLGNVNYRSRYLSIELAAAYRDAIREAADLLCMGISLVLLCACSDERTCHRSYVAKLIQDTLPVPAGAREVWHEQEPVTPHSERGTTSVQPDARRRAKDGGVAMPRLRAVLTLDEHLQVFVLESQFPPPLAFVFNSEGESAMRRAQKRGGNTKVPDNAQGLMQPRKPAQQKALSKIRHAHSRTTGIVWYAPNIGIGDVLDPIRQYPYSLQLHLCETRGR